jgi:3-methylcrotonyl-CoA carboxylase alpha subunit
MITGLDLVEWQLRIADGEKLPLRQSEVKTDGHAFEARIYAEDPARHFAPGTGRLTHLRMPAESAAVRVDSGVREGDTITPFYDAMIAKLIVHGESRAAALAKLVGALREVQVAGPAANVEFLMRIATDPALTAGPVDTNFVDRRLGDLAPPPTRPPSRAVALAALAEFAARGNAARARAGRHGEPNSPWSATDGWRLGGASVAEALFQVENQILAARRNGDRIGVEGKEFALGEVAVRGRDVVAELDAATVSATVVAVDSVVTVFDDGRTAVLGRYDPLAAAEARAAESCGGSFAAPMPGVVVAVMATAGAHVEKGTTLMVIEAMKVEHAIKAFAAGTVTEVRFAVGDQVAEGDQLVAFTPDG